MNQVNLDAYENYFSRELSWLEFNWRVLEQAQNEQNPLLERLKFIGIVASNLDEFFMKRIGGLKRQIVAGVRSRSVEGRTPQEQMAVVRPQVREMIRQMRACLVDEILPSLKEEEVRVLSYGELNDPEREYVNEYFQQSVFPILTPLGVDPAHPFPFISNLSLSLVVKVRVPGSLEPYFARVKVPGNRPRWIPLPNGMDFIPLEQIIANNLHSLFPGTEILQVAMFRVVRNAELERNEEEAEDLLEFIQEELRHRRFAQVVRLDVDESATQDVVEWLMRELEVPEEDVHRVTGLLALADFARLSSLVDRPDLKDPEWRPVTPRRLLCLEDKEEPRDIFSVIRSGDILLHHPYESFDASVLRFLEVAAEDPSVLAIKQTLYRTSSASPIVQALARAAANGKQVAVLVEIRARFDEANNIEWVRVLERAGAHVSYGVIGLKIHTKTLLVIREEPDGLHRYFHIGTGNYHTGTATLYTDLGLLSCDPALGADLTDLFNSLTGHGRFNNYRKILIAPTNMREEFIRRIRREAEGHSPANPGRIFAKMNSLEDKSVIRELYLASQAGVQIDLIVRGFCCLRPGVPGVSENIRILSIIGRFLEHSRIFYFRNGGGDAEEFLIGSADWMYRNLDARVEAITPVEAPGLREELRTIIDIMLTDNEQAWELQPDGSYRKRTPGVGEAPRGTHRRLMERASGEVLPPQAADPKRAPGKIAQGLG